MKHKAEAVLLGAGFAGLLAVFLVYQSHTAQLVPRPEASGEIGVVAVFGQVSDKPVQLPPDRVSRLVRPNDLAFQLTGEGTGPRWVRVEVESGTTHYVAHEEKMALPATMAGLDFVMHLDEATPDEFAVVIVVEAPHSISQTNRYPILLVGAD